MSGGGGPAGAGPNPNYPFGVTKRGERECNLSSVEPEFVPPNSEELKQKKRGFVRDVISASSSS